MNPPPFMYRDPRMIDTDHLKLLSIFHFVGAGLAVLGLLFVFVHFTIMRTVFMNPQFLQSTHQPAPPIPPAEIIGILKWFYLAAALWMIASAALNPRPSGTAVYKCHGRGSGLENPAKPDRMDGVKPVRTVVWDPWLALAVSHGDPIRLPLFGVLLCNRSVEV